MLHERPMVSVIIPTYNGGRYIAQTIESALAQTYPNREILVIDDGSTDETVAIVAAYAEAGSVTLIQKQNGGTASARNTGIQRSHGALIALLDHDDRWHPDKLEKQVAVFAESSRIGMVHTGALFFHTDTGVITSEHTPRPSLDYHGLLTWCQVTACTAMFTREAYNAVGPFDESLLGSDDWDMWVRIAAGYEVRSLPDTLAEARLHGNNQGSNAERTYQNCMRIFTKTRADHPTACPGCRRARRIGIAGVRSDYYGRMSQASNQALRDRKLLKALTLRAQGLRRYPEAVLEMPRRLLRKLCGMPVETPAENMI